MPVPRNHVDPGLLGIGQVVLRGKRQEHPPGRRCADSTCRCLLARDNPGPYCSPCDRRVSQMPAAIHDYLAN